MNDTQASPYASFLMLKLRLSFQIMDAASILGISNAITLLAIRDTSSLFWLLEMHFQRLP